MIAVPSIDPDRFLDEQLSQASPDLMRDLLTTFVMPCSARSRRSVFRVPQLMGTWSPSGRRLCRSARCGSPGTLEMRVMSQDIGDESGSGQR